MITISLCMIVKNEEATLERCLASAADIADEIIVVDTGSTDATRQIAARYADKVLDYKWRDDFAAARNYSFRQATKQYIMWLDADDVIEERDKAGWLQLKQTLDRSVDAVLMPYHLSFDEAGNPLFSMRRNRLVRRDRGFRWKGAVHEYLQVNGISFYSDAAVSRRKVKEHSDRKLRIYEKKLQSGEPVTPHDLYYYANELYDHSRLEEAVSVYERFCSEGEGWVEDVIAACLKMAEIYGRLGDKSKQMQALFRSFAADTPRAEACCRLGALFFEQGKLKQATYWYKLATTLGEPPATAGMVDMAAWTWFPHVQLCLCYDRAGEFEKAYRHNEIALSMNPQHPSMLHNKAYFDRLFGKED
jgi:glycosyltransferase involved in cell wall biosynthesis